MERKFYIDFDKIIKNEDGSIQYMGYTIHKEGHITNPSNKKVAINKNNGYMRLKIGEEVRLLKAGRFVWELVNGRSLERSELVEFIDGNVANISFDNLKAVDRTTYFKGHKWTYKFDEAKQKDIIREYQEGKTSIAKLASKHKCCKTTIWKILNDSYTS